MKHSPAAALADLPDGAAHAVSDAVTVFRVPKARFRKGNTYALARESGVLLVDVVHGVTAAAVDRYLAGRKVLALLLTHSDLLGQAYAPPPELSRALGGAPVLIARADVRGSGATALEDSTELLAELGVDYYPIPGHTPGSVLYRVRPECLLFAGDGVVGRPYGTSPEARTPSHAPIPEADWAKFVEGWASVPPPVEAVLPLHGVPLFGPESLAVAREAATRRDNLMQV